MADSFPPIESAAARRPPATTWIVSAAAGILIAMAAPWLAGRTYLADDLGAFHLPARAFYARCLQRGEPFDWMPEVYCGHDLGGEGQAGMRHPLHWALYRWLPLEAAFAVELLLSYPLMFAGCWLFFGRLLRRGEAAALASLLFTFGSFNLLHFIHPNAVAIVAHVPWLLWAIDILIARPSGARAAPWGLVALLTGSQLLLGYPQYVWFSLLAEGAYLLPAILLHRAKGEAIGPQKDGATRRTSARPVFPATTTSGQGLTILVANERGQAAPASPATVPSAGNQLACVAAAKLVGLAIGAAQLLPTADALLHSARTSAGAEFANTGALDPLNLLQLLAPYLFHTRVVGQNTHELGLYLGAAPLLMIAWLWTERRRLGRYRRLAAGTALAGICALLLAMGDFGVLYRFQRLLPGIGSFRFPCRAIVLVQLAAAVLAGIALVHLRRRQGRHGASAGARPILMAITTLSLLVAIIGLFSQGSPLIAGPPQVLAGPLLIAGAALLLAMTLRGVRGAMAALILWTALDLGLYAMSYAIWPGADRLDRWLARIPVPPGKPAGRVVLDGLAPGQSGLRSGNEITLRGWSRADGYAGLEPAHRLDYRQLAALRVSGVEWVRQTPAAAPIQGLGPIHQGWRPVPNPLPPLRLVTDVRVGRNPAEDIRHIDLESSALVDAPLQLDGGPPGTVRIVGQWPGRIEVDVDCASRQLLIVSQRYQPGWRATVADTRLSVIRVNGDFLGIPLGAGRGRLVLEFAPAARTVGGWISLVGMALAAVAVGMGFRKVHSYRTRPQTAAFSSPLSEPPMTATIAQPRLCDSDTLLSVVLPVYNEAGALSSLHESLVATLGRCGVDYEILFVNDGSSDESPSLLDRLAAEDRRVRVVHLARNFGHQAAVQAGLAHTRGDAIVLMDSDLQDAPEAIPQFLARWREGYDVVYALRTQRKENAIKRGLFALFHRLLSGMASVPIPADAGIFGLVDRRVARAVISLGERDRYFPGLRSWVGLRQTGVPVPRNARYDRHPRVSLFGLFRLAKTAIFSFSTLPLTAFYAIGLLAGVTFLAVGGFALACRLFTDLAIPGWTSHVLIGSFFGALNALGICILGEYVIRIYDQVRARPLFLVDRTVNMDRPEEHSPHRSERPGRASRPKNEPAYGDCGEWEPMPFGDPDQTLPPLDSLRVRNPDF